VWGVDDGGVRERDLYGGIFLLAVGVSVVVLVGWGTGLANELAGVGSFILTAVAAVPAIAAWRRDTESKRRNGSRTGNAGAVDVDALVNLGRMAKNQGRLDEAEQWFRKAADTGHTGAMVDLGLLLQMRGDLADAEEWFRKAADAGDDWGMQCLGGLLRNRGDIDDAEKWYRKSAGDGHTGAMVDLGLLLRDHRDDLDGAEEWLRKGADAGNGWGMHNLGRLLRDRED